MSWICPDCGLTQEQNRCGDCGYVKQKQLVLVGDQGSRVYNVSTQVGARSIRSMIGPTGGLDSDFQFQVCPNADGGWSIETNLSAVHATQLNSSSLGSVVDLNDGDQISFASGPVGASISVQIVG